MVVVVVWLVVLVMGEIVVEGCDVVMWCWNVVMLL
jgi:hypothetical protein